MRNARRRKRLRRRLSHGSAVARVARRQYDQRETRPAQARLRHWGAGRFLTAVIRTRAQSDREAFENATLCRWPSKVRGNQVVHKGRPGGEIAPESSGKTNLCQRSDGFLSSWFKFIIGYQILDFLCLFFRHLRQTVGFARRPPPTARLFNKVMHRFGGYLIAACRDWRNRAPFLPTAALSR